MAAIAASISACDLSTIFGSLLPLIEQIHKQRGGKPNELNTINHYTISAH